MGDSIPAIIVGGAISLGTWLIRRGLIKYERALVAAERARRDCLETELGSLKTIVAQLHAAFSVQTREREALINFLTKWASQFEGNLNATLQLHAGDSEELRETVRTLVKFFNVAKDSERSTATQIGPDLFLVHKRDLKGK